MHIHGTCWVIPDTSTCYINIPKNASTALKEYVKDNGGHEDNYFLLKKKYEVRCFIRNPVDRFISGLLTQPGLFLNEGNVKLFSISSDYLFDCHLTRQVEFIKGIEVDVFQTVDSITWDKVNVSKSIHKNLIRHWIDFEQVNDYYSEDLKLYLSI